MSDNVANGFIDVSDHGLLLIQGPDASQFLQGQVTCDIKQLTIEHAQSQSCLGAHCSHKGRMLFSFRACALNDNTIALCLYKELIPSALTALKKYSVFSKVEISDAREQYKVIGLITEDAASPAAELPSLPTENDSAIHVEGGVIIRINEHRYECWLPNEAVSLLTPFEANTQNSTDWNALNIADGIGEVRPETIEEFIPQMLNFQAVSQGISFKKGCYTGQEVVARMQYLGKLKKRMYRFALNSPDALPAGATLFTPESSQAIGHVVFSAAVSEGQELLAVVSESAVNQDNVFADKNCQQKLHALPLPYAITKE